MPKGTTPYISELDKILGAARKFRERAEETTLGGILSKHFDITPDEPYILTGTQARAFKYDIPEDWSLKMTRLPGAEEGSYIYQPTPITAGGWEILGEDEFMSPTGERLTATDLEAMSEDERLATGLYTKPTTTELPVEEPTVAPVAGVTPPQGVVWDFDTGRYVSATLDIDVTRKFYQEHPELLPAGVTPAFTPDEWDTMIADQEAKQAELVSTFRAVLPDMFEGLPEEQHADVVSTLLTQLGEDETMQEWLTTTLLDIGLTSETAALMMQLGYDAPMIHEFFAEPEVEIEMPFEAEYLPERERAARTLAFAWNELKDNSFSWGNLGNVAMASLGTVFGPVEKYIVRPWDTAIMEYNSRFQLALGTGREIDRVTLRRLDELRDRYGWASALVDEEVTDVWQKYLQDQPTAAKVLLHIADFANPAFLIPIGGTFGLAAKFTSKIPLLGKSLGLIAKGVNTVERGVAYPLTKPLAMSIKGLERVGIRLSEKAGEQLLKRSQKLVMDIDDSESIVNGVVVDNWMRRAIQTASKIPPVRVGVERALGTHILVDKTGKAVMDVVGRGAILNAQIRKMGTNLANIKKQELRAIMANPVKDMGFNKQAYSASMAKRLLPAYGEQTAVAGTLEHVLSHPEMYRLTGTQAQYITRFNELQSEVLNLLVKEGIPPEHIIEDWVHRVVVESGKPAAKLRRPRAVGAKPSYERPRKFKTMAEGIDWFMKHPEYGAAYANNPELLIGRYVEEAFNKIAGERFLKYTGEFGVTPSARLAERFPEIVERAQLTKTELADAAKFQSVVMRASRGERIPEATMKAMERRLPDLTRRLRGLMDKPQQTSKELSNLLKENQRVIRDLQSTLKKTEEQFAKAKAIDVEAIKAQIAKEARMEVPDEVKLREAFKVMDWDERATFRSSMLNQMDEVGQMAGEHSMQIEGLKETLTEIPANKWVKSIKTSGEMKGEIPNLTVKQYTEMTGRAPKAAILTKDGKYVRWEYALDDAATELGYASGDAFREAIYQAKDIRDEIEGLQMLLDMAQSREAGVKKMLRVLDDVDATPKPVVPKAEPGMPEAGVQRDIFGYDTPVFPKGKGEVTQIGMDDYAKLAKARADAGLPPPDAAIKPKIEGIKGLEGESQIGKLAYEPPKIKSATELKAEYDTLKKQAKSLVEERKAPYWQARTEKALEMERMRPELGEGYVQAPFAGGKIYEQDFIDSFNKFFGYEAGHTVLKATADAAGILRITKAALDFSAMAIQGLPSFGLAHAYMLVNPKVGAQLMGQWYKAAAYSVRGFFDPQSIAKYIAKNTDLITQRVSFTGSSRAIDYFAALEARHGLGGLAEAAFRKIPLKPFQRAETSFFGFGEIVRDEFWKILSPKAIKKGKGFELARHLDLSTGLTEAAFQGVPLTSRQLEQSFLWFAPNYTRSCLTLLADIFRGGMSGDMARKSLGALLGAGIGYYSATQFATALLEGKSEDEATEAIMEGLGVVTDPITGEVTWQPTGRFMTLKVGNYYFGIGGFWYGLVRLAGNIMATVNEVGERERIDLIRIMKHGSLNKQDNPFIAWWYSRSSPIVGTGFELATGRDYLGYPIETPEDYAKHIATRFEPIWMEQGLNWMIPGMAKDNEIPEGAARKAIIPAEVFGLRTFPESSWVKFYDKANEYISQIPKDELDPNQVEAWKAGKLAWRELSDIQKMNILSRYSDLTELYEEGQADSAVRASPHWKAWQDRMDEERRIYIEGVGGLNDRTQQLLSGEIDTRKYRELAGEAGQNYGSIVQSMERDEHYAEIYEYFESKEARGDKYGYLDDIALAEIQSTILYAEDLVDAKGDYDWRERDRRIDEFIDKYGQAAYDRIQQYLSQKKEQRGIPPIWIRKAEDTEKLGRGYWRLPYKPIYEMDEKDYAEGNIPDEYKSLWSAYQKAEDKEAFLELHPELKQDFRAEYRLASPEEDARLALWGYGGRLQTMEAYNLVEKWSKELGISMENMGLGLPPRSLAANYFDYNKIAKDWNANSPEAKYWRTQNEGFEDWAIENWDWKRTDVPIDEMKLRVDNRELFDNLKDIRADEALDDITKDEQGLTEKDRAIAALRATKVGNNTFRDIERMVDAYSNGTRDNPMPESTVNLYVGHMQTVDQTSGNSAEAKLNRYRNSELNEFLMNEDYWGDNKAQPLFDKNTPEEYFVPIWEIDAQYRKEDAEYDAIKHDLPAEQRKLRDAYLAEKEDYRLDSLRRDAYKLSNSKTGYRFPTEFVEDYVTYSEYGVKGQRQQRMLVEGYDPKTKKYSPFAQAMFDSGKLTSLPEPKDVPAVQFDDIYDQYPEQFDKIDGFGKSESDYYISEPDEGMTLDETRDKARNALRFGKNGKLTEFGIAENRRDAHEKFVAEKYVERYVDLYNLKDEKKYQGEAYDWPKDKDGEFLTWYEDDWYFLEHPNFYDDIYVTQLKNDDYLNEKDKDGVSCRDKVPSRTVWDKYVNLYREVVEGKATDDIRLKHRDLDAWGQKVFGWEPIEEKRRKAHESEAEKRRRLLKEAEEKMLR